VLKGTHFVLVEDVKAKTVEILYSPRQNMICGTALNIGSIVCSCVSTENGTTKVGTLIVATLL